MDDPTRVILCLDKQGGGGRGHYREQSRYRDLMYESSSDEEEDEGGRLQVDPRPPLYATERIRVLY